MNVQTVKLVIVGITFGLAVGIGVYTFVYAKGYSYMSNNPGNCANCHIMQEQYDGWQKSSHHTVATCNDCHTPHDTIGKYYTKASNGFNAPDSQPQSQSDIRRGEFERCFHKRNRADGTKPDERNRYL